MLHSKPHWIAQVYYWLTERLYNELAWTYDPVSWIVSLGQWSNVRNWALDYLIGTRVLEVGFDTGELLLEMVRRKVNIYGLEPSLSMQRLTMHKLRRSGMWVPQIRGVTQQMPFADNCFDTIFATFPSGYIFDLATWREVERLLRKPFAVTETNWGRFIVIGIGISSPSKSSWSIVKFLFGLPMEELLAHFKQLAQLANLDYRVETRKHFKYDIPIIIAEKKHR